MNVNYEDLRITKLRTYLIEVIDEITSNSDYQINAYMLSNKINNYSIDKIPTQTEVERWVNGVEIHRDIYSFRSRNNYSQNTIENLKNVGFFEIFENKIRLKNREGILPDIDGIEEIKCLNCGTMLMVSDNTAEFDIQIQITYKI